MHMNTCNCNCNCDLSPTIANSHGTCDSLPTVQWRHDWGAEYPWRLGQIVEEHTNWRGTWTLEVKNMLAMDWENGVLRELKDHKHGLKHKRMPTRHLPFVSQGNKPGETLTHMAGGLDDLMTWLGKA
ncbi:hypothetical protein B0H63DRAFT_448246 [Podospora didyma]|uniref:Uncharacterized protein n=1 Tax=Podospora didyma TaxID=330526 RepID=A0AAE0U1R6_9PEZI|nr:hypothetical protein B0H63DRAFT_448246 [Podospora didyma]